MGAGLLVATGAIHLDLYVTGYRAIPTIGPLFLVQAIVAVVLAAGVVAAASWVVPALGAGFAVATLGGYVLSMWIGLFGFTEVPTTAGIAAGSVEVVALGVLTAEALRARSVRVLRHGEPAARVPVVPAGPVVAMLVAAGAAVLAAAVLAAALSLAPGTPSTGSGRVELFTRHVGGAVVLTDPQGFTLYWFAADSPTRSRCYGTCASVWPPVLGRPVAGPGVVGRLGTITRTDGALQVTYDGHPLYRFAGDVPGTAHGNDLDVNGGIWHEMTVGG